MNRILKMIPIFIMALSGSCNKDKTSGLYIRNLRCEYMTEAVIAKESPRFSWELVSDIKGLQQTAWQVIVSDDVKKADAGKGNIWNSGKRKGNETFSISMNGKRLRSFTKYYWRTRVWDNNGKASAWSQTADFITGAFDNNDWKGRWIGGQT